MSGLEYTLNVRQYSSSICAGGSGCSSMVRPKPDKVVADGGDGGDGGDVIILADSRYEYESSWRGKYIAVHRRYDQRILAIRLTRLSARTKRVTASAGIAGSSHGTKGARGADSILKVSSSCHRAHGSLGLRRDYFVQAGTRQL